MSRFARVRVEIITQQGEAGLQRLERASKDAAQGMQQLDQQVEQVEQSQKKLNMTAGQTANALRRTGRSSRSMSRLLGQAGQASGSLSGTMTTLVPQLGGAAMVLGEVASSAEMFAGAGASVLRVLGPIAAAAVAAGAAYAYFNGQLKEAEERQRKAAEGASKMVEMTRKLRDAELQAALARDEITQEEFNAQITAQNAQQFFAARVQGLRDERREIEQQIVALKELNAEVEAGGTGFSLLETLPAVALVEGILGENLIGTDTSELSTLEARLAGLDKQLEDTAAAQSDYQQSLLDIANGAPAAAGGVDTVTDALKEQTSAAEEAFSARVALSRLDNDPTALGVVGIGIDLSDPTPNRDRDRADLRSRLQANRAILDERIGAGADELAPEQQTGRGAAIAGAAASFASGDALGMLGMIGGPAGAIASSAVAGLSALGDQGAEGVVEAIKEQTRSLVAGIGELPDLISEIPELLAEMLPELIGAIVELPTLIVIGIVEALASLGQMIVEGLRDALRGGDETRSGAALRLATSQTDSIDDRTGVAAALFMATADRNHNGLTVSDQEVGSILQVGEVVTARGDMMPQSAAVHGARAAAAAAAVHRSFTTGRCCLTP